MVHEKQMQNDTENGRSRRSTEYINNNEFYCALENHFFAYKTHTQNINIVNMHQRCRIHTHTQYTMPTEYVLLASNGIKFYFFSVF